MKIGGMWARALQPTDAPRNPANFDVSMFSKLLSMWLILFCQCSDGSDKLDDLERISLAIADFDDICSMSLIIADFDNFCWHVLNHWPICWSALII